MAKVCCVCEKGRTSGNKVSHSNRKTRRSWAPNLQKVTIKSGNGKVSDYVCTSCLKHGKVERV